MRVAELVMAIVLAVFSLYLMVKSAELPIGWIEGGGPGGGSWPFWLATGMLLCTLWIILSWLRKTNPFSKMTEPFMSRAAFKLFLITAGSLTAMIALFHIVGTYFAVPLFIIFYMRVMGGHGWKLTGAVAAIVPVMTFFFFEIALNIFLPKGFAEPLFLPLYDIFL